MTLTSAAALELVGWRRRLGGLYAAVRAVHYPERARRMALGTGRPVPGASAEPAAARESAPPDRTAVLPYWDYDPAMRFELRLLPAPGPQQRPVPMGADQTTTLRFVMQV